MSIESLFGQGRCPQCGRFCRSIIGFLNEHRLLMVEGVCRTHGRVEVDEASGLGWSYEDFVTEGDPL